MPQMAPLLWLWLMIMFVFIFCVFFVVNYYMNIPSSVDNFKGKMVYFQKNWKW